MSGATVLIVDDEHSLARSAKAFLADHGYETEVAGTAEQALELLASLQPDVVFADVRLPGMSGLDLLRRIRESDPGIPVIMLTAYGSIEGAVEAVKLGAFDYVKKPVDLEELKLLADRARENRLLRQELSYYRSRATRDVGLPQVVLGHGPSPPTEDVADLLDECFVALERHTHQIGDHVTRDVVLCWPEAAAHDDRVAAVERLLQRRLDARPVVADLDLKVRVDTH